MSDPRLAFLEARGFARPAYSVRPADAGADGGVVWCYSREQALRAKQEAEEATGSEWIIDELKAGAPERCLRDRRHIL